MLCTLLGALWPLVAAAEHYETSERFDNYILRYNAVTTDELPDLREQYGIKETPNKAMIIVTLQELTDGDELTAPTVDMHVAVTARNLIGQIKKVKMRKIVSNNDISYIGTLDVLNEDWVNFHITVEPADSDQVYRTQFHRQFFTKE
ncbi:MAG: DUF4426 domain-containing protein [Pseudomonadota bacterium]